MNNSDRNSSIHVLLYDIRFSLLTMLEARIAYSHRTLFIRHVRNLFKKFRLFLRNSLTNFLWRNVNNTNGPSLRIPSQTFVKNLHQVSKDIDDDRTRNFLSNYTGIVYIIYRKDSIIIT